MKKLVRWRKRTRWKLLHD